MNDAVAWAPAGAHHPSLSLEPGVVDVWRLAAPRGAAVVRELIARYAGVAPDALVLVANAHGKPQLASGSLCFNLSHSGGTTLLAFTAGVAVGVDVEHERIVRRREALLSRCFTMAEQDWVRAAPDPDGALLIAWTAKEALVKAVGRGLAYGLKRVELALDGPRPALAVLSGPAGPAVRWSLRALPPLPGAVAALAHAAGPLALRCFSA